jgi:hypothetical protein
VSCVHRGAALDGVLLAFLAVMVTTTSTASSTTAAGNTPLRVGMVVLGMYSHSCSRSR